MSEPFLGEIKMFAGNFAPPSWALLDGQLLAISQNDALFALLGTTYGGDGQTTFGLPDLRGRVPVHEGQGPGLSPRALGAKSGLEKVTVTTNQIPSHKHDLQATTAAGNSTLPIGKTLAPSGGLTDLYLDGEGDPQNMGPAAITNVGGSQSHTNLQPFLCLNFIIALFGIFPSRN